MTNEFNNPADFYKPEPDGLFRFARKPLTPEEEKASFSHGPGSIMIVPNPISNRLARTFYLAMFGRWDKTTRQRLKSYAWYRDRRDRRVFDRIMINSTKTFTRSVDNGIVVDRFSISIDFPITFR